MRHLLATAAACALTATAVVTYIPAAQAHASLETRAAPPGGYKAVIRIPHGCDGQPTNSVRVEVPEGYIDVKPQPKAGWELAIEAGDYAHPYKLHGRDVAAGAKAVTWSGGALQDSHYDEFVLSGTLAGVEAGQSLFFKTLQLCADGKVDWNEVPAAGQDPHSLDHPAPGLTIMASSDGHAMGHGAAAAPDTVKAGDLEIASAFARAMLAGQKAAGAYLTVTNHGGAADRLTGGSSPAAGKVEVHTMEVANDVMTMRPVEGGLEIPAGGTVELKPGGFHLMLMDVAKPFGEGDTVPVTLTFEKAGTVELMLPVRVVAGAGQNHGHKN